MTPCFTFVPKPPSLPPIKLPVVLLSYEEWGTSTPVQVYGILDI